MPTGYLQLSRGAVCTQLAQIELELGLGLGLSHAVMSGAQILAARSSPQSNGGRRASKGVADGFECASAHTSTDVLLKCRDFSHWLQSDLIRSHQVCCKNMRIDLSACMRMVTTVTMVMMQVSNVLVKASQSLLWAFAAR